MPGNQGLSTGRADQYFGRTGFGPGAGQAVQPEALDVKNPPVEKK